jgi:acyl carrier protein
MNSTLTDQVRQIAADVFGEPLTAISAETSPKTLASWDSLQHLNLMLAIEETFGVQISPEDAEQMSSIAATVEMLQKKLG